MTWPDIIFEAFHHLEVYAKMLNANIQASAYYSLLEHLIPGISPLRPAKPMLRVDVRPKHRRTFFFYVLTTHKFDAPLLIMEISTRWGKKRDPSGALTNEAIEKMIDEYIENASKLPSRVYAISNRFFDENSIDERLERDYRFAVYEYDIGTRKFTQCPTPSMTPEDMWNYRLFDSAGETKLQEIVNIVMGENAMLDD